MVITWRCASLAVPHPGSHFVSFCHVDSIIHWTTQTERLDWVTKQLSVTEFNSREIVSKIFNSLIKFGLCLRNSVRIDSFFPIVSCWDRLDGSISSLSLSLSSSIVLLFFFLYIYFQKKEKNKVR